MAHQQMRRKIGAQLADAGLPWAYAEADLRLLQIARAETDPSDQVDLWDVLAAIGFPPEGPVTVA